MTPDDVDQRPVKLDAAPVICVFCTLFLDGNPAAYYVHMHIWRGR